jgi:hypothetical protein
MLPEARKDHHSSGEHERRDEHSRRRGGEQDEQDSEQPEETGSCKTGAGVRPIHEEDSTPLLDGTTARSESGTASNVGTVEETGRDATPQYPTRPPRSNFPFRTATL